MSKRGRQASRQARAEAVPPVVAQAPAPAPVVRSRPPAAVVSPLVPAETSDRRYGSIPYVASARRLTWTLDRDAALMVAQAASVRRFVAEVERRGVEQLRREHVSWARIGALLGVTGEAARQRFGR